MNEIHALIAEHPQRDAWQTVATQVQDADHHAAARSDRTAPPPPATTGAATGTNASPAV